MTIYRGSDIIIVVINELLKEKGMSRYSLSKADGIPWANLSDICSGKIRLTHCNAQTLQKLSGVLDMTIEDILALMVEPSESQKNGKPFDRF